MTGSSAYVMKFPRERLVIFLEQEMGLDLSAVNLEQTLAMIAKSGAQFSSFDDYAAAVASMISVHETYFLRHNNHYEWLEKTWLPELATQNSDKVLRILSAGCSTGEEPYSLYAHLAPIAEAQGLAIEITAVDISKKSLDIARQGKYGLWSLRGVCIDKEQSWLDVKARSVYVKNHIKDKITFRHHNLCQLLPQFDYFDLVLCRNVLIYMHMHAVELIYRNLCQALKPGAFLIPGPSDPNPPERSDLVLEWRDGIRLYQKKSRPTLLSVSTPASVNLAMATAAEVIETPPPQNDKASINNNHAVIETLIRSGHYDLAKKTLETNLEKDKFDVRSYVMLAVLALDLDEIDIAKQAARKASFLDPESPYTVYTMSDVKNRMGDKNSARNDLLWVKNSLQKFSDDNVVPYCEEITIRQLKDVVDARLSSVPISSVPSP